MKNYKRKVLSFQPGSIYQNGGMSRILRRIYEGHEFEVISLFINYSSKINKGKIEEIGIDIFPMQKSWMRWKLRFFFSWLRNTVFFYITKKKVLKTAEDIDFDILHTINHSNYSAILCNDKILKNKKLWTSFHDHFRLCSSFKDTELLWNKSERRFVISSELGLEYQKEFGNLSFEIITDGLYLNEVSKPKYSDQNKIMIYFGGLLHIEYYELFEVLAKALDTLVNYDLEIKLVLRGTQKLNCLSKRNFLVEYREDFITDVKEEIDLADVVYLPIKFSDPDFYLFSLSTKMIGYLGASGTILYHGPTNSAALNMLKKYESTAICDTLNVDDMIKTLKDIILNKEKAFQISANAKELAKQEFDLNNIQNRFWNN